MKFMLSFAGFTALALAAPSNIRDIEPTKTKPLEKRATTLYGQWDSVETGGYTIYNNLWGKDSGSGSQLVDNLVMEWWGDKCEVVSQCCAQRVCCTSLNPSLQIFSMLEHNSPEQLMLT
ncbi:unnamed protein product [Clonostachys chloroleuca]|uniref:Uncharacterized protein n=1 Tax=Clonostachys chloroleuca TaxID=1926264 RepID=A0AA35QBH2_9HYPO|nr:unnamed protein product [Clonostachys chloroleuca]